MAYGMGMGSAAMQGAEMGSAIPGVGTIAGTAIGGASGLLGDIFNRKERKKAEKASRPEHRRMTSIQNALNAYRENKLASQLSLSQAAFDWANNLRL